MSSPTRSGSSSSVFEWTPDFWQGWREGANPYRQLKSERDRALTLEALQLKDGEKVLEVGCGYGWITASLVHAAKIRWVGLDRSESMIQQLRTDLKSYDPFACVADACRLPFSSNSFDKVLCTGVLMHIPDERPALAEIARVLRPGGIFVSSINNSLSPYSLPVRAHNSSKEKGFTQNFRLPSSYGRHLRKLGFRVLHMRGDGLFTTVPINLGRFSFPPKSAFRALSSLDQWITRLAPWFAYEVWFAAVKQ